jgi:hypothetical protein
MRQKEIKNYRNLRISAGMRRRTRGRVGAKTRGILQKCY